MRLNLGASNSQSGTDTWACAGRSLVDVIQMLMCFDDWNSVSVSRKCKCHDGLWI